MLVLQAETCLRYQGGMNTPMMGEPEDGPFPTLLSLQVLRAQGGGPSLCGKPRTSRIPLSSSLHLN